MTTENLYYLTLARTTRLGTGVGQRIDPPVWVSLYNATQASWFGKAIQLRGDSVLRDQLSYLYRAAKPVVQVVEQATERFQVFTLPDELYQITEIQVEASTGSCKTNLLATPIAPQYASEQWEDPMLRPDFYWGETWYSVSSGKLLVYKRGFQIDKVSVSYYAAPVEVDLPGYPKLSGEISEAVNSDMPDELQQEIITMLLPVIRESYA